MASAVPGGKPIPRCWWVYRPTSTDADFLLGLELILDGVAVRIARSDP
ncbi:hypothetical protein [Micromonospora noduli]|nr:hypothetical protein [Micromonospora noduli]